MKTCRFELNSQEMSFFEMDKKSYRAFSGLPRARNDFNQQCVVNVGPIPAGAYYIVDRKSGGLGILTDRLSGRSDWFALYAADGSIDDKTLCNEVERGNFRLHPKGPLGISTGCIVIENLTDFELIREVLLGGGKQKINDGGFEAYAKVVVERSEA